MAEPMYPGFATEEQAERRAEDKAEVAVLELIARSGGLI